MMNGLLETVASGVDETVKVMAALAGGDLNTQMTGTYKGAFAELQGNVNGTVDKLRSTVLEIQHSADAIKIATGEIAQGSGELSSRAEHQAASLEQIAAMMQEMSATVQKKAENAVNASNVSADAREHGSRLAGRSAGGHGDGSDRGGIGQDRRDRKRHRRLRVPDQPGSSGRHGRPDARLSSRQATALWFKSTSRRAYPGARAASDGPHTPSSTFG